jgi:SAM-dependent methyltransferase
MVNNPSLLAQFGSEYAHREGWSVLQRIFIRIFGIVDLPTRIRARAVISAIENLEVRSVLDLGAGTGIYSFFFARDRACACVAIDVEASRVRDIDAIARLLNRRNITTINSGTESLKRLEGKKFDLLLAIEVLQYFDNIGVVLRELKALMGPNSRLVAHIPIRTDLWPFERKLFNDMNIVDLFESAGLSVEVIKTFNPREVRICRIFTRLAKRKWTLIVTYPIMLALLSYLNDKHECGDYRLIIAKIR